MQKRPVAIIIFALLFCFIGSIWLSVIYQRSLMLSGEGKASYKEIYKQSVKVYQNLRKNVAFVSTFFAKACLILFWIIGTLELVCAFLYLLSGWSLFRLYSFSRGLTIFTVFIDVLLKLLISIYYTHISLPIQFALGNRNILTSFYMPDKSIISQLSGYLAGIKLVLSESFLYTLVYSLFIFIVFYFFTRNVVVKQFSKQKL